jgi:hypothetical protein
MPGAAWDRLGANDRGFPGALSVRQLRHRAHGGDAAVFAPTTIATYVGLLSVGPSGFLTQWEPILDGMRETRLPKT